MIMSNDAMIVNGSQPAAIRQQHWMGMSHVCHSKSVTNVLAHTKLIPAHIWWSLPCDIKCIKTQSLCNSI